MVNDEKRPIVFPDEEPIKLKIPPKSCELCGKPFIPTGGNAKYCPRCRELSKAKRNRSLFSKHATMAFGYGPWSEDYEETVNQNKEARFVEDAAQVAVLIREIEEAYGMRVASICSIYEHRTSADTYERVPFVQLPRDTFYKVFSDKPFEYYRYGNFMSVRRWEGKVLFEAVIH